VLSAAAEVSHRLVTFAFVDMAATLPKGRNLPASCATVAERTPVPGSVCRMKPTCLALGTLAFVAAGSAPLQDRYDAGVAAHLERSLDAASAAYDAVLVESPPRAPSADEWRAIERFAPRVFTTAGEPFELRDVAAIVHPETGVIAFHFFWDDDIDYPDDNDPSDHEVVWSIPSSDRTRLLGFRTYFHGRELAAGAPALGDAAAHGGRPAVYVQWGKHGAMPLGWERLTITAEDGETESTYYPIDRPITLEQYNHGTWRKLTVEGRRQRGNPIAARLNWPERFEGDWRAFSTFPKAIDVVPIIRRHRTALVTRWTNAALNRWLIRYNFKPKTEWPDLQ
jgi:hypothetical protein